MALAMGAFQSGDLEIGKTVPFRNGIPFFSPETETVFDLWMTFCISVLVKKTDENTEKMRKNGKKKRKKRKKKKKKMKVRPSFSAKILGKRHQGPPTKLFMTSI